MLNKKILLNKITHHLIFLKKLSTKNSAQLNVAAAFVGIDTGEEAHTN